MESAKQRYARELNNEIAQILGVLYEIRQSPGDKYDLHIARIETIQKKLPTLLRIMLFYKNIHGGVPTLPPVSSNPITPV